MNKKIIILLVCIALAPASNAQNPWNGKVVLQGFWWDYWNNNYPNAWADYLAELAPRLKDMGVDAVWIPPSYKNAGTNSVGYSPFDHYDLGDKFQKGSVETRVGNKDQFLRMVAILHANGLEVIQDVVLNHVDNAGSQNGSGGQDAYAAANYTDYSTNGYKNFRYVSYATPASSTDATNYLNRSGRWPKNWTNFYPNQFNACCSNDINSVYWGPDISYESNAYGQSSCTGCYNPTQSSNYMKDEARNWLVWFQKQTGVDGYRFDAVKHFSTSVVEDLLYNAQHNAGFSSNGNEMFAVGEYVGSASQMDSWANATQNRAGTFDFSLRGGIYNMVYGMGNYNLGNIPGSQQSNRYRTVPFVNNHDTYRPQIGTDGSYVGWNTGDELAGHIDPNEPRLEAAYAIAFAVDGSPLVFFEDLFVLDNSDRFTHDPTNSSELVARGALENIMWCHQKLEFKTGAYKVRHSSADHLIIERSSKAIISVNDNWNTWQSQWVPTDFGAYVQLHDYSGANSSDIWTDANGWVQIWTPPCDGSNVRRGYSIWGPTGIGGGFNPSAITTSQEWEMDDDLGDSHASSLGQGGAIPASSKNTRTAGRIFSTNSAISVDLYPSNATESLTLIIANSDGSTHLDSVQGTGNLTLNYTPSSANYYTLKVRNTSSSNSGQKVWVKATYTAPQVVNTSSYKQGRGATASTTPNIGLQLFPNPAQETLHLQWKNIEKSETLVRIYSLDGRLVLEKLFDETFSQSELDIEQLNKGVYTISVSQNGEAEHQQFVKR